MSGRYRPPTVQVSRLQALKAISRHSLTLSGMGPEDPSAVYSDLIAAHPSTRPGTRAPLTHHGADGGK